MTAKDRWTTDLACPKCKTKGEAEVWQEDGWSFSNGDQSTHLDSVSAGFRAEQDGNRLKFFCTKCGSPAT